MDEASQAYSLAYMREVKARHESSLLSKANVVAVGIGIPMKEGKPRGEIGIIVSVTQKIRASDLAPEDLIPQILDDIKVWVEEIDRPRSQDREQSG